MQALAAILMTALAAFEAGQDEEAKKRETFLKEFKDKTPAKRIDAVQKMGGSTEDKSIVAVAAGLKDPVLDVKKAVAGCLQECTDAGGSAVKPLCAVVNNKKEDKDVRLACIKALAKEEYKAEAIDAMIQAITIDEKEKELYMFGAEVTRILAGFAGQDFGATKETPAKWQNWYKLNQGMLARADAEKLAAWKKSAGKGK
ncbi:MAG TPA: hypothetical protein VE981_03855 [Planctomycetota bacterium]|nr:hypothetical protein [Planctomycetota bacterium]